MDENKLDDLLKEVADSPAPPGAPAPPPEEDGEEADESSDITEECLLPSQRSGGKKYST